jgi:hypothetical protein
MEEEREEERWAREGRENVGKVGVGLAVLGIMMELVGIVRSFSK